MIVLIESSGFTLLHEIIQDVFDILAGGFLH